MLDRILTVHFHTNLARYPRMNNTLPWDTRGGAQCAPDHTAARGLT